MFSADLTVNSQEGDVAERATVSLLHIRENKLYVVTGNDEKRWRFWLRNNPDQEEEEEDRRQTDPPVFSLISHRTLKRAGFIRWQFSACFLEETRGSVSKTKQEKHAAPVLFWNSKLKFPDSVSDLQPFWHKVHFTVWKRGRRNGPSRNVFWFNI